MKHGITFGTKHSYRDFGLVPTSRPVFQPPEPDRQTITIPGRNRPLDLSRALTGEMTYKEREGSFEFLVPKNKKWHEVYSQVMNELHATNQKVILDDDPGYYYDCYIAVNEWKSSETYSTIAITALAYPYKRKISETKITKVLTSTAIQINCENLKEPVVPIVKTTGNAKLEMNGKNISLNAGIHAVDFVLTAGNNIIKASGTGTIEIIYREGGL